MTATAPFARAVVCGGAGAVGAMLVERLLREGTSVTIVDLVAPEAGVPAGFVEADTGEDGPLHGIERSEDIDLVVLALPEAEAMRTVDALVDEGRDLGTMLLVETLSVKTGIHAVLQTPEVPEALGINPMFRPTLDMSGRSVLTVDHRPGPRTAAFIDLLAHWGARPFALGAAEHDRAVAATQALTHAAVLAFGGALAQLGVDAALLAATAPPPHQAELALLARIVGGAPEVYWDVQVGNPFASAARDALVAGATRLRDAADRGDRAAFDTLLAASEAALGREAEHHRNTAARIFEQLGADAAAESTTRGVQ